LLFTFAGPLSTAELDLYCMSGPESQLPRIESKVLFSHLHLLIFIFITFRKTQMIHEIFLNQMITMMGYRLLILLASPSPGF